MSEDLYAKLDLSKTVGFQRDEKEDRNADNNADIDNATIYDNYWAKGTTPPKSQDNTTDDQRQTTCNVSSGHKNVFRAVFLVLLCLVILAAVIFLVTLWIQDKNNWTMSNEKLINEKDQLLIRYRELESLNHNLTLKTSELEAMNNNLTYERDKLQTSYHELKSLNHNLTLKTSELEAMNNNLISERDKLKSVIETKCCSAPWNKVGNSCYRISTSEETWYKSKQLCEMDNAHLVSISSDEEQKYITSFGLNTWIGLTDKEREYWKWVNGEPVPKMFWARGQPDSYQNNEHCAELATEYGNSLKNWNDLNCETKRRFTCEKVLL